MTTHKNITRILAVLLAVLLFGQLAAFQIPAFAADVVPDVHDGAAYIPDDADVNDLLSQTLLSNYSDVGTQEWEYKATSTLSGGATKWVPVTGTTAGIIPALTAGKAGFITALYIVLVPLAGMFLGKKANKRLFLCVLIAVVGLYFLCFTGSEGAMSFGRGDFLVFLCAFAFTGHILCVDHYVQKVDGIALSCVQFAVMMVLSTVCAFTFETVDFAALGECMFYILYIGILSSAGGYTLQILAQKDGDPTVVSLLLSLESFFAVVCGAIILHERMSGREYLGCALMLTAVLLSQLPEKTADAAEPQKK